MRREAHRSRACLGRGLWTSRRRRPHQRRMPRRPRPVRQPAAGSVWRSAATRDVSSRRHGAVLRVSPCYASLRTSSSPVSVEVGSFDSCLSATLTILFHSACPRFADHHRQLHIDLHVPGHLPEEIPGQQMPEGAVNAVQGQVSLAWLLQRQRPSSDLFSFSRLVAGSATGPTPSRPLWPFWRHFTRHSSRRTRRP